ncbi:MAG: hypothetical protein ACR2LX_04935 [Jatrophihabitans sp.]
MAVTAELSAARRRVEELVYLDDFTPLATVPHRYSPWPDADDQGLGGYQR